MNNVHLVFVAMIELMFLSLLLYQKAPTRRRFPDMQLLYCLVAGYLIAGIPHFFDAPIPQLFMLLCFGGVCLFYRYAWNSLCCFTIACATVKLYCSSVYLIYPNSIPLFLIMEGSFFLFTWLLSKTILCHDISTQGLVALSIFYGCSVCFLSSFVSFMMIILLCLLFLLFIGYINKQAQLQMQVQTLLEYKERYLQTQQHFDQQTSTIRQFHKEKHDMKERIQLCRLLLEAGKLEVLQQLLQETDGHISQLQLQDYTGILALDSVLSYYQRNFPNLTFSFECDAFDDIPLSFYDASTLLINLLKNAVEAAPDDSTITLQLRQHPSSFYLSVRNDYNPTLPKKQHDGYGFSILDDLLRQYHGTSQISKDESTFFV